MAVDKSDSSETKNDDRPRLVPTLALLGGSFPPTPLSGNAVPSPSMHSSPTTPTAQHVAAGGASSEYFVSAHDSFAAWSGRESSPPGRVPSRRENRRSPLGRVPARREGSPLGRVPSKGKERKVPEKDAEQGRADVSDAEFSWPKTLLMLFQSYRATEQSHERILACATPKLRATLLRVCRASDLLLAHAPAPVSDAP
eukprot:543781-Rhodomonas_salina.1